MVKPAMRTTAVLLGFLNFKFKIIIKIIITLRRAQRFGDSGPYENFDFFVYLQSICLSFYLFVYLFVYLFICLFVYLYLFFIYLFICNLASLKWDAMR